MTNRELVKLLRHEAVELGDQEMIDLVDAGLAGDLCAFRKAVAVSNALQQAASEMIRAESLLVDDETAQAMSLVLDSKNFIKDEDIPY